MFILVLLQHLAHGTCFWLKNQGPTCYCDTNQSQQKKQTEGKTLSGSRPEGLGAVRSLTEWMKCLCVGRPLSTVSNRALNFLSVPNHS